MAEQDNMANRIDPNCPSLVDGWTSTFRQAAEHTQEMLGTPGGTRDPRAWRRQWFDTLGQMTDVYLRSPVFLQMLKAHVDTLIQTKHPNDSQRDTPSSSGGRLTDDLRAMKSQLEQLERRLEALETMPCQLPATDNSQRTAASRGAAQPDRPPAKGTTPCEVVYHEGTLSVVRYCNDAVRFAEPILVCFALVNRPYILDLQVDRSVVRRLLDRGLDVYLIDWGVPGDSDRQLRLEDYVCSLLSNVVNFVCDSVGTSQLSLLGYCMGGTMSTMFTALQQDRIRNLILMATPIDFHGNDGLLNLWAREEYFDVDKLVKTFGNCPGELLQFVFQLMKPVQNFAEKQLTLCENLHDATFLDNFVAVERWANDSIPVAGETFRQYVTSLYQQNQLVNGQMKLAGKPVRLEAITCPLLMLVAEKDHLVPPESSLALQQYVSSKDVTSMSINAGHVGLAVSSRAHRQLWPDAANWIANHSTET